MNLDVVYGLGRLGFGAALMAAPGAFGNVLLGGAARKPTPSLLFSFYGTRDVVMGLGMLRAAAGGDTRPWLAAGIACDVLDAAVMVTRWNDMAAQKRVPGLLTALGAGGVGAALLARR